MKIFLIGFMGSGKSTTGKWLAGKLDYEYIDLDLYIEKMTDLSVLSIFSEQGEESFRSLERKALIELINRSEVVIATGGGTPCYSDNMELMNRSGKTVYLEVSADNLFKRLIHEKEERPLIKGKSDRELKRYINDVLKVREIIYRKAQIIMKDDLSYQDDLLTLLS